MENVNPKIVPICDLLNQKFYIPRYQRGYRWGQQQVDELLDDILEYSSNLKDDDSSYKINVGNFYCLQPVVVTEKEWNNNEDDLVDGWEVIDGQQRLTTIYLILCYLEEVRMIVRRSNQLYSLDFETRKGCAPFFNNKKFVDNTDKTNVDFYHMCKAYEYIKEWFARIQVDLPTVQTDVLDVLLNNKKGVSIIWYNTDKDPIDTFVRLNDQKIPLTDAELIKALLLQSDIYPAKYVALIKQRTLEIASEWDYIESTLYDDRFWFMLNGVTEASVSRIDFIFQLLAAKWNEGECLVGKSTYTKHYIYVVFNKYLEQKREALADKDVVEWDELMNPINTIWFEVKELYSILYEWYQDNTLYHYIGYILTFGDKTSIGDLITSYLATEKNTFVIELQKRIAGLIEIKKKVTETGTTKGLHELAYGEDDKEIIKILVHFNIESHVKQEIENSRFPFHLYKKNKISSIEHIHPQNPEGVETYSKERCIDWLTANQKSLRNMTTLSQPELLEQVDAFLKDEKSFEKSKFVILHGEIIRPYNGLSSIALNEVHTLFNLALVDKDTNSELNNSPFDIKREILKKNKHNKYIPLCTRRAFGKYYSSNPNEMTFWGDQDRKEYFAAIKSVYNKYMELI